MATLSPVAVAALAYTAGWKSASENATAVAVARQESGFSTTAANSCCVGLWQINLKAHGASKTDMQDPGKNAAKAFQIYRSSGGWCSRGTPPNCNPWQGYGARDWQTALSVGAKANSELTQRMGKGETPDDIYQKGGGSGILDSLVTAISPGAAALANPGDTAAAIAGSAKAIVEFLNRMGAWVGDADNWTRVLKVTGGVVAIVVGSAIVAKDPIAANAMKVLPVGKAAKLIKGAS